jgi:protein O-mannosyl-transferase
MTATVHESKKIFYCRTAIHILCVVILGFLIYSSTLDSPFVFDDETYILNNPALKDPRYFLDHTKIYELPESYGSFREQFGNRLIVHLSFLLNYAIHDFDVTGFHIFNVSVHIMNALLVYLLVNATFNTPLMKRSTALDPAVTPRLTALFALVCALLFTAHPLQTQAVTYISQRVTSLAVFFFLLSLFFYIRARLSEKSPHRYLYFVLSLCSAILAMKTKEISFTLPVVIALYELMFLEGKTNGRILCLAPFLLTMAIIPATLLIQTYSGELLKGFSEVSKETASISRSDYLFTQFSVIVTYLWLLVLPVSQNLDYDYPVYQSFFVPQVWLSFLLLVSIFVLAVYLFYRSRKESAGSWAFRLMSFGILYFFITLSVESSLIPIKDIIFEHRVYLPSFGFFLCITAGAMLLSLRLHEPLNRVVAPVMIIIIIVFAGAAYSRNMIWSSAFSLWTDAAAKSPLKARPHANLGRELYSRGDIYGAVSEFQTAVRLDPNHDTARYNLGLAYLHMDRLKEAEDEFRAAINADPSSDDAYVSLGIALFRQGRHDDAYRAFLSAAKINPYNSAAYYNIAAVLEMNGEREKAIEAYSTAARLRPDDTDTRDALVRLNQLSRQ